MLDKTGSYTQKICECFRKKTKTVVFHAYCALKVTKSWLNKFEKQPVEHGFTVNRQTGQQTSRQANQQADRPTNKQTGQQTSRQANKQADRPTSSRQDSKKADRTTSYRQDSRQKGQQWSRQANITQAWSSRQAGQQRSRHNNIEQAGQQTGRPTMKQTSYCNIKAEQTTGRPTMKQTSQQTDRNAKTGQKVQQKDRGKQRLTGQHKQADSVTIKNRPGRKADSKQEGQAGHHFKRPTSNRAQWFYCKLRVSYR